MVGEELTASLVSELIGLVPFASELDELFGSLVIERLLRRLEAASVVFS